MCGYCFEQVFLNEILEQECGSNSPIEYNKFDGLLVTPYSQETNYLLHCLKSARASDQLPSALFIIHCRGLEDVIYRSKSPCVDCLSHATLAKHYHKYHQILEDHRLSIKANKELLPHPSWIELYDPKFIFDSKKWSNFLKNQNLLPKAVSLLEEYYHWWILGDEKDKNDLSKMMEETGIFDPIEDIKKEELDRFYGIFPALYFSLVYLSNQNNELNLIEKIALTNPDGVPDFPGFDLWLQRKALLSMIRKKGVSFLIDNLNSELRVELVYYAFLKLEEVKQESRKVIEKLKSVVEAEVTPSEFTDSSNTYIEKMHNWPKIMRYH